MVIIALLLECLKPSANVARLHPMCGSRAELSRAHGGGASDHCVLARALAHREGGPIFLGGGNRRSQSSEISSRKRLSPGQKFVLEMLVFVGRLCKTCVSSGYKILGSER